MRNFIPIDRSTFRRNPDAGSITQAIPLDTQLSVVEMSTHGRTEWRNSGRVNVDLSGQSIVYTGEFMPVRFEGTGMPPAPVTVSRTFSGDMMGVLIKPEFNYKIVKLSQPSPNYLYAHEDTTVTCPEGHQHKVSELDDYEDDDVWVTNLCPTCGERVEGIERENPEVVAAELGI